MPENAPLATAQAALFDGGLINLVVLEPSGTILAARGRLVENWPLGDAITDHLMVLTGMEDVIATMADPVNGLEPVELPTVFLGGNHEDGQPGFSVRLSALSQGQVMLLLQPLSGVEDRNQTAVQQYNDLALHHERLSNAHAQSDWDLTTREALFDTLRWDFRLPLTKVVQDLEGQKDLQTEAQRALGAVDDWMELLALKTKLDERKDDTALTVAFPTVLATIQELYGAKIRISVADMGLNAVRVAGSSAVLLTALRSLLSAAEGQLRLDLIDEADEAIWQLEGIENAHTLALDYRWELARTASLLLGGALTLSETTARLGLPKAPLNSGVAGPKSG